jgi:hypothetical protein
MTPSAIDTPGRGTTPDPTSHLTDELLQQQLEGVLSVEQFRAAQAHLDICEPCRTRGAKVLERGDRAQRDAYAQARKHAAEQEARRKRAVSAATTRWWLLLLGAGVAAVAWMSGLTGSVYAPAAPVAPTLEVRRGTSGQLTVSAHAPGAPYLLLYSREGAGPWTPAWPADGRASGTLASRGSTAPDVPPGATELLAVFSRTPLAGQETLAAVERTPERPVVPGASVVLVPVRDHR